MPSRQEFSRNDRVRKALIREVSDIIANQVKNPLLEHKIISVTDLEVSKDFRHAKVFISVMGDEEFQQAVMGLLETEAPKIRMEIGKRIRLRYTPELVFLFDDSLERGSRVSQLLNQISKGEV